MSQKTILYVERENLLTCKVADRLTFDGYRVQIVDDPARALRIARLLPPNLIILNMDLLGVKGTEITEQLRRSPGLARVPIIALTGEVLYGRASNYMAAGCDCCLFKPFHEQELSNIVRDLIGMPQTRAVGITYRGSPWAEQSLT